MITSAQPPRPVALRVVALCAYPVLIVAALWLQQPELRALGMPLLAVALVGPWPGHMAGRLVLLAGLMLALAVIAFPSLALWPPGLLCMAVAGWFGASLRHGQRPMIERFAAVVHEEQGREMPSDSQTWMRGWTLGWSVALAMLGAMTLVLAAMEKPSLWLAWVTGAIPLAVLALLWLEYALRRRRFPQHEHWPLLRFLLILSRIAPERLAR